MPCFAIVNPDQIAALEVLGSFKQILGPGFHFVVPWARVRKVSTRVVENRVITETKTKDNVFVTLHIAVQQEVHKENAMQAIYKLREPAVQIESFVADVVRSHVPLMTLDSLFEAKDEIAGEVKERLADAMNSYGYKILQVLITDIDPAQEVKDAMNQINTNVRIRVAAGEKAEADKMLVVKAAEAEAEVKFLQGQGLSRSRAALITGLRDAVEGSGSSHELTPKDLTELMLMTQYLDTLEKISTSPSTKIFLPHDVGAMADIKEQIRATMNQ